MSDMIPWIPHLKEIICVVVAPSFHLFMALMLVRSMPFCVRLKSIIKLLQSPPRLDAEYAAVCRKHLSCRHFLGYLI